MARLEDERLTVGKEQEPKPKVFVTFYGYLHEPLNAQVGGQIGELLDRQLQETPGRNILFHENTGLSRSATSMVRDQVKRYGLLVSLVNGFSPPGTKIWDVERIIRETSQSDINTIIKNRLIPEDQIHGYFLQQELERLRQKWGLEVENESHSKPVHERIVRLREGYSHGREATQSWADGNFREGLDAWKKYYQAIYQLMTVRDPEIVEDLKDLTKKLMREKEGGSIILLFGGSHSAIIDVLQRKLGPKVPVKFEKVDLMPNGATDTRILLGLQSKTEVDDLTYAQDFFVYCMNEFLRLHFLKKADLATFANNWQTINAGVVRVANSLAIEDIKYLVDSRGDFVGFLKNRPESNQISNFIS